MSRHRSFLHLLTSLSRPSRAAREYAEQDPWAGTPGRLSRSTPVGFPVRRMQRAGRGATLLAGLMLASALHAAPVLPQLAPQALIIAPAGDLALKRAAEAASSRAAAEPPTALTPAPTPAPTPAAPDRIRWPLPPAQVPDALKDWVPWAMQGHEMLACPSEHANGNARACLWPERLDIGIRGKTATFEAEVSLYGPRSAVPLPGEKGAWPGQVRNQQGQTLPVVALNGQPAVWLPPGRHTLRGQIEWTNAPQALRVPPHGLTTLRLDGEALNPRTDENGRIWLRKRNDVETDVVQNALDMRIRRLIDDAIPRRITTHYELNVAGEAREMDLPAALLEGTRPAALHSSGLPARLHPDGRLQVQLRPGNWTIEVEALQMSPVQTLALPKDSPHAEVWSYQDHNDLHVTRIEGVASVDPNQSQVPHNWLQLPAYEVSARSPMKIVATTQGSATPPPAGLSLVRELWIDFDGRGMTQKDAISGLLSGAPARSWRLEQHLPTVLGHASVDGTALPITRLHGGQPGVELRERELKLSTLSRIDEREQALAFNGLNTVLDDVTLHLNLPPGWMLLHAGGMDSIQPPTLTSRWNLYDLFFLMLTAIAAHYLLGWKRALILLPMLVVSWHELVAIRGIVQLLLVIAALHRYLTTETRQRWLRGSLLATAAVSVLLLLPWTLKEIRLMAHPTLEHADYRSGQQHHLSAYSPAVRAARKAAPEAADILALRADASSSHAGRPAAPASSPYPQQQATPGIDMSRLTIQTGPGEPRWHWTQYELRNRGQVLSNQPMSLTMLSVWPARVFKALRLVLLHGGLYVIFSFLLRRPGGRAGPDGVGSAAPASQEGSPTDRKSGSRTLALPGALMAPLLLACLLLTPGTSQAAEVPDAGTLRELRERLYPAPACSPHCAALGQMQVSSSRHGLSLKLAVHTQAEVQVPLPGVDSTDNWRLTGLLVNGKAAISRRDAGDVLWVLLPPGVHVVEIRGQIGGGSAIRLPLPMNPQMLQVEGELWRPTGLREGLPADSVLNLELHAADGPQRPEKTLTHMPDALPGFALVERRLAIQERWQLTTRITRQAESRAPVRVRFQLLPGESINDGRVQVKDGIAEVHLGQSEEIVLNSTLTPVARLSWHALPNPDQIEIWQLRPGTLWHAGWQGINPVAHVDDDVFAPWWQPWPGERLEMTFVQPDAVPGPTRTLERQEMTLTPGLHSTAVHAELDVRASLAGIQPMMLPEGAEFLGLTLDGENVPVQPRGRELRVPLVPGLHTLALRWREPRGTSDLAGRFDMTHLETGLDGSNAITTLSLRHDRVVLAAGGPILGPAVLFWSLSGLVMVVAVLLGRYRLTPLGAISWFVLLLGVAPTSWLAAALLVLAFVGFSQMPRLMRLHPALTESPWTPRALMALLALAAGGVLWSAVQTALLGFPDMLIAGNGSSAFQQHWYQDRFSNQPQAAWVYSISLTTYRVLMLVWALWMAFATVRWVRWGVQQYQAVSSTLPPTPPAGPTRPGGGAGRHAGAGDSASTTGTGASGMPAAGSGKTGEAAGEPLKSAPASPASVHTAATAHTTDGVPAARAEETPRTNHGTPPVQPRISPHAGHATTPLRTGAGSRGVSPGKVLLWLFAIIGAICMVAAAFGLFVLMR